MHFVEKGRGSSPSSARPSVLCVVLIPLGWNTGFRLLLLLPNRDDPWVHFRSMLTPSLSLLTRASSGLAVALMPTSKFLVMFSALPSLPREDTSTSFLVRHSCPTFRTLHGELPREMLTLSMNLIYLQNLCTTPANEFGILFHSQTLRLEYHVWRCPCVKCVAPIQPCLQLFLPRRRRTFAEDDSFWRR